MLDLPTYQGWSWLDGYHADKSSASHDGIRKGMAMIRRVPKISDRPTGAEVQAAEHEAAKQRILAQAEAERTPLDDTTQVVPDRRGRR
ncbi:hypothetical protein [Micromonospora craniellae]|uniref:hypothetical protein n=1 Tax=Micromonospora craniellae TaxID=2294034 RepID=UPI00168BC9C7|nr:hypothetical protein ID554_13245 [Micromonospora craniellae]